MRNLNNVPALSVWGRRYIKLAVLLLFLTGGVKVLSTFGSSEVLATVDPIFGVSFRLLMLGVGAIELGVATICLFSKRQTLDLLIILWLSSCFLTYRLALQFIGWLAPCPCLGSLTSVLPLSRAAVSLLTRAIFLYLLLGSAWLLCLNLLLNSLSLNKVRAE